MELSKELQADSVRAIGRAPGAIGDKAGARTALQAATDVAGEILPFGQPSKRARSSTPRLAGPRMSLATRPRPS